LNAKRSTDSSSNFVSVASQGILIYSYYSKPWELLTGDDVRIHTIARALGKLFKPTIVYSLSHLDGTITARDGVVYISVPRKTYRLVAKLLNWNQHYDLNPLMKLTHYIDEFIAVAKLRSVMQQAEDLYVFGSMTLLSLFVRMLGVREVTIIYDPLSNYAQTLYFRSRFSKMELLRYGLYLALHRLQLKYSDYFIYPSKIDFENAKRMFDIGGATIIPNSVPICYESIEEYRRLREKRRDPDKPYFILLAGGKGKTNEEAVRITIEIFNDIPPDVFHLYITGPWRDLRKFVKNPSIEILGIVPVDKLRELLATSDYGLAPIFSHAAGTFLKVLAYIAAGLHIISSPFGFMGIDIRQLRRRHIFIVKNAEEYREAIHKVVSDFSRQRQEFLSQPQVALCKDVVHINSLSDLLAMFHVQ